MCVGPGVHAPAFALRKIRPFLRGLNVVETEKLMLTRTETVSQQETETMVAKC